MPGVRDLVEGQAHEHRRLVSALAAGDPLPAAPLRPGRAVVAGVALGVLALAVGVLVDLAGGSTPPWPDTGVVVAREGGATYVVLEGGAVHPVTGATSARLLLGDQEPAVLVDQDVVDEHEPGPRLGIAGAPASVPAPADLVGSGWTACATGPSATSLTVGARPTPALRGAGPPAAVVVRAGSRLALVTADDAGLARAFALPVSAGLDNLLLALGVPGSAGAVPVPGRWLDLLPRGGPLSTRTFGLADLGGPLPYAGAALPADARIGDWFPAPGGARLLTSAGPVVLTPFALATWRTLAEQDPGGPRELAVASVPPVPLIRPRYAAAGWPTDLLEPLVGRPCLSLEDGPRLSATEVEPTRRGSTVEVVAGRGSLVADPGRGARPARSDPVEVERAVLVADDGRAYPVEGADALEALGLADVAPTRVPTPWLRLLPRGPVLSVERALNPPAGGR